VSETIPPNTTIAQYTIVSKIGEGGLSIRSRMESGRFVLLHNHRRRLAWFMRCIWKMPPRLWSFSFTPTEPFWIRLQSRSRTDEN